MEFDIRVIVKEPNQPPKVQYLNNTLQAFQEVVGGYIQHVPLLVPGTLERVAVICNEDGRILGLPFTCMVNDISYVGTIIFVSVGHDGEYVSISNDLKNRIMSTFEGKL